MIQNDKQLLLVDLCGRLPYGVKCRESGGSVRKLHPEDICRIGECMPYLRPMSAMSEEEKSEFCREFECAGVDVGGFGYTEGRTLEEYLSGLSFKMVAAVIGWLNAHHFDYRGLIERGLALEAPEEMYIVGEGGLLVVGDHVIYLNDEYIICDIENGYYVLESVKKNTSTPVVHVGYGSVEWELRKID